MANKQALRDLQTRLAERLQAARTEPLAKAWLAVECSSRGFLFPLSDAGEIFAMSPLLAVPHSHRWFLGVKVADPGRDQARLVGFNQALNINCVLLVDRLSGLRSEDELTRDADDDAERPAFAGARFRDASARVWQELNLGELANDESFLRIVG